MKSNISRQRGGRYVRKVGDSGADCVKLVAGATADHHRQPMAAPRYS
uniref:Uncharacterized protein MANES_16G048300 n=1 Tax=Rhizophora mucronata TaxID=61149 RepID=A0A2P2K3F6_RHIMU